ncbi:MAG: hypothetical protein ACJA0G_002175 [Kangiellaceae bacterium]|jgi:hypothetical protein
MAHKRALKKYLQVILHFLVNCAYLTSITKVSGLERQKKRDSKS